MFAILEIALPTIKRAARHAIEHAPQTINRLACTATYYTQHAIAASYPRVQATIPQARTVARHLATTAITTTAYAIAAGVATYQAVKDYGKSEQGKALKRKLRLGLVQLSNAILDLADAIQ